MTRTSAPKGARQIAAAEALIAPDGTSGVRHHAAATISEEGARALTHDIQTTIEKAWLLIEQAYTTRAWAVLGYSSWDDYCDTEFRGYRLKLPLEDRREAVGSLRDAGLSVRAIASAVGISKNTVRNDIAQVGHIDPPAAADARRAIGLDDTLTELEERIEDLTAAEQDLLADVARAHGLDDELVDFGAAVDKLAATTKKITGTDGKTYTASPPKKPRRRVPLPDAARTAGWDLVKAVERIERIAADDRFPANRDAIVMQLRGQLSRTVEVLADLLDNKIITKNGAYEPFPPPEGGDHEMAFGVQHQSGGVR